MKGIGLVMALGACTSPDLGQATQAGIAYNGIAYNGIVYNAMTFNSMTYNSITYNTITHNSLSQNGIDLGNGLDLDNPDVHMFVEYLVQCALPAGSEVTIADEPFAGALGVAPEWAEGPCGESCQRWVSACLLARVNARGEHVQISMRGPSDSLHPGAREIVDFPVEDGTFFGNVFVSPQQLFATSPRADLSLPRTCGADCGIDILGSSQDLCTQSTPARGRTGCPYEQAVTVYLR